MPAIILAMGSVADVALNTAIHGTQLDRFLPEICGMTVGMLTVLTFAMRRQAYLASGIAFLLVEMVVVTLTTVSIPARLGLCAAALLTATACFIIYACGPWAETRTVYAESRRDRS